MRRLVLWMGVWGGLAASAWADVPRVATDILPVHGLAARVMQGVGAPDLIIGAGVDPHAHQLRPSEARALSQADLVLWVGPELTPGLARGIDSLAANAKVLSLLTTVEDDLLPLREGHDHGHGDEHDEDHDDDHKEGHEDHQDDHHDEEMDAHAWLDPHIAKTWVQVMAENLATLDPDNAATYRANAAAAQGEIDDADQMLKASAAGLGNTRLAAYHDAYQYLEHHLGLRMTASLSDATGAAPGAQRVSDARDAMEAAGRVCLLTDPAVREGLAENALDGLADRIVMLDPLGSSVAQGPGFYPNMLRGISAVLDACAAE